LAYKDGLRTRSSHREAGKVQEGVRRAKGKRRKRMIHMVNVGAKPFGRKKMKTLRGKFLKWLAWIFWKLHIITEKEYVNFLITLIAVEAGLRIKEVPIGGKINESSQRVTL